MNVGFDAKRLFFNGSGLGNYARSTVRLLAEYAPDNRYTLFTPREGNCCGFEVPDNAGIVTPQGIRALSGSLWRSYAMGRAIRLSGWISSTALATNFRPTSDVPVRGAW